MKLVTMIILAFSIMKATTAATYRAKKGSDSYFKSKKYKKSALISYAELWAEHFGLSSSLIKGQIEQESGWDAGITSYKGAKGLMQIMPKTASCKEDLCLKMGKSESLYNPYTNIYYGCMYMKMMLDKFGNMEHALMAYYGGPARLERILDKKVGKNLVAEISNYAGSVYKRSIKYTNWKAYLVSINFYDS